MKKIYLNPIADDNHGCNLAISPLKRMAALSSYVLANLFKASLLFFTVSASAASVDDLKWIAQDYKPYGYMDSAGQKAGLAIEIADKIMAKIGSKQTAKDIELQVFSRSFIRKNNDPNVIFFPLAKLPEREKYFKWVGPIAMDEPVLFAKKAKNIVISNDADLKKYSIVAKDGYGAVKTLKNLGNRSVELNDTDEEALQKIKADKADLVLCNKLSCVANMKTLSMNLQDYAIVYKMPTNELAIAFNKDTSDELVDKVRKALAEIKLSKEYGEMIKHYSN